MNIKSKKAVQKMFIIEMFIQGKIFFIFSLQLLDSIKVLKILAFKLFLWYNKAMKLIGENSECIPKMLILNSLKIR